jgi:hypothetical protein
MTHKQRQLLRLIMKQRNEGTSEQWAIDYYYELNKQKAI